MLMEIFEELPSISDRNGEIERLCPVSLVDYVPGHGSGQFYRHDSGVVVSEVVDTLECFM